MIKNLVPKLLTHRRFFFAAWIGLFALAGGCAATKRPVSAMLIDEDRVVAYFQDRIAGATVEEHFIPYEAPTGTQKLRMEQVSNARAQVWELWKNTHSLVETLPQATPDSITPDSIPVHVWELKEENPMPFYFIHKGDGTSERAPLFLNLHGSGPKTKEFEATLQWSRRFDDRESYYFIPQIPSEERYRWWYRPQQYTWERLFRLALLDDRIDPNRLFIIGISEGGYGSQRLGAYYADYLAGVGPMAGGEPLQNAPPLNYRHVAFSFQTGENDRMFGRNTYTLEAKERFAALAAAYPGEFPHQIVLQPGRGHGIDYTPTTPWLRPFSRVTRPMHISWVHFPMHTRYRNGFYNVGINETFPVQEGDPLDRVLFDIQYLDNEIHITADFASGDLLERKPVDALDISLFVDETYIDFSRKVNVLVNGQSVFNQLVQLRTAHLVESCGLFGDPQRLYPGKIVVQYTAD